MANLVETPGFQNPRDFQLVPDVSPLANAISGLFQRRREDQKAQELAQAKKLENDFAEVGLQFQRLRKMDNNVAKRTELARLGQEAARRGEDTTLYSDALAVTNPDELNLFLTSTALRAGNAKDLLAASQKADLEAQTKAEEVLTQGPEVSEVQSSKILPSGVVQIVRKDGTTEVNTPGAVAEDIIKRAEDRGVDLQQQRAQGRSLGKDAAKIATKLFSKVGTTKANNRTLRKVITEIEAGAETGPLAAQVPSIRAASVRLDQVRSELGLDVVGSVTFGALSEGELNLAMSTALPTKLEGPELVEWAKGKIAAQEKLIEYLEDQAIFLSEKGNTPAMWLLRQRDLAPKATEIPESAPITQPNKIGRFTVEVE